MYIRQGKLYWSLHYTGYIGNQVAQIHVAGQSSDFPATITTRDATRTNTEESSQCKHFAKVAGLFFYSTTATRDIESGVQVL